MNSKNSITGTNQQHALFKIKQDKTFPSPVTFLLSKNFSSYQYHTTPIRRLLVCLPTTTVINPWQVPSRQKQKRQFSTQFADCFHSRTSEEILGFFLFSATRLLSCFCCCLFTRFKRCVTFSSTSTSQILSIFETVFALLPSTSHFVRFGVFIANRNF